MNCDVVFEGGGAKGIALVGAWQEFQDRGYGHDRILGTSAGAIMAAFLTAGYSTQEMFDVLTEKQNGQPVLATFLGEPEFDERENVEQSAIAEFLRGIDLPLVPDAVGASLNTRVVRAMLAQPRFRNFYSFVERGGWFSAHAFVAWLEEKLDTGSYQGEPRRFSAMTLAELYTATHVDLSLVASDTTSGRLLVLNHRTAPDCPVVWAVRMSMSIPLLWQEVIWQEAWGGYRGRAITGHAIVDGGLLSNFPLELFLSDQQHVTALMGPKTGAPVVGFLIDEALPISAVMPTPRGISRAQLGELRTFQRIGRLIDTAITAHDKLVMDAYAELVVRLPAWGYGTTEFDMSDERRDTLIEAGRLATRQHLSKHPPGAKSRGADDASGEVARTLADRIAEDLLAP
jgi:predicted acylesterase/phospholipase RssA